MSTHTPILSLLVPLALLGLIILAAVFFSQQNN